MKLGARRRTYLREAIITLAIARLAVRFVPVSRIFAWVDRPLGRVNRFATHEADWIFWAVEHIAAQPRMNADCLPSALAAHAMLRRRGIASRLCLGVAREGCEFSAHAWVEIGKDKLARDPEVCRFIRLAEFGGVS
jgi:hypothetical protein